MCSGGVRASFPSLVTGCVLGCDEMWTSRADLAHTYTHTHIISSAAILRPEDLYTWELEEHTHKYTSKHTYTLVCCVYARTQHCILIAHHIHRTSLVWKSIVSLPRPPPPSLSLALPLNSHTCCTTLAIFVDNGQERGLKLTSVSPQPRTDWTRGQKPITRRPSLSTST